MIGAWDFKRMRSCAYMKEGGSARGSSFRFWAEEEEIKFLVICDSFIFVGVVCISVLNKLQDLVALEGRMPEGVDGCNFMKDKLFPLCLTSFSLMQLNIRCRSLWWGMMKINRDLVSDKVWQLYVSCGVCICNSKILYLKLWEVRVWRFVGISNIHSVFAVMGFFQGL
jgi:hypothetical protein